MAGLVPQPFPIPLESAVASYPYQDIKEGTGFVLYYGVRVSVDATAANDDYLLITNSGILPSSSYTQDTAGAHDIDFDVQFNTPKVVSGPAVFVMPVGISGAGSIIPKITVKKYDGSSESTLVAETAAPNITAGAASYDERTLTVTIPQTKFKSGEILRITFTSVVAGTNGFLYHDPGATETALFPKSGGRFSAFIPFKLDL